MTRRTLPIVLVALAAGALLWLLWDEAQEAGFFDRDQASRAEWALRREARDAELAAEIDAGVRLRGLPGFHVAAAGVGRVEGRVTCYRPSADPLPLAGVEVRLVGRSSNPRTLTDAEGGFSFEGLPAALGYAVVVDHPPYKEVVLRGLGIRRDHTTDVGTILLGAPTALTGEVVDAAGRPVAGAEVHVFFDRSRALRFALNRVLAELNAAVDPLAAVRAASDGRFEVEGLPPGRYVVRVSAPGYATVFREGIRVTADERAPALQVVLDRGAGYAGRVADEAGRGIAGARVIAVAMMTGSTERMDRVEATSASDGRYRLDSLVAGTRYFLEAWAEGYAPAGRLVKADGFATLDLVLGQSGRVAGFITDRATGAGVEGAEVALIAGSVNTLSPVATTTASDGSFALEHVSAGPVFLLSVKASGYPVEAVDAGGLEGLLVRAGETTTIDRALDPGRSAYGTVVDERGRGVAHATVAFADPQKRSEDEETGQADPEGAYSVGGLRAGATYEVRVEAPGYAPVLDEQTARVEVPKGSGPFRHDVRLILGATLTGRVTDPDGAPVGGARLEVQALGGRREQDRLQDLGAVTAATGVWRIAGVPPDTKLVVTAFHDEWVRTTSDELRLASGEEVDVALALGRGARLSGRVTDGRGLAVAAARVRWGPIDAEDEGALRDEFRADRLLTPRVVRTVGDGSFVLTRLEPGPMLLKVEADGFAAWYRKDVVVPVTGDPPSVAVELISALAIEGTVIDALSRRPIAEAWIYARAAEDADAEGVPADEGSVRSLVSTQTDERGRYRLEGVAPGRYRIVVWLAIGYRSEVNARGADGVRRDDVEAGARGVDFALASETQED